MTAWSLVLIWAALVAFALVFLHGAALVSSRDDDLTEDCRHRPGAVGPDEGEREERTPA